MSKFEENCEPFPLKKAKFMFMMYVYSLFITTQVVNEMIMDGHPPSQKS
jgi:hypothetical protein